MNNLAVIDLGTNTFHLLIVEIQSNKSFKELYRERVFVNLAEDGIQTIGNEAFKRAYSTLDDYYQKTRKHNVKKIRAIGTEALRFSSNGQQLVDKIYDATGIVIEIISGNREAELIYQGIRLAIDNYSEPYLIMDIGGGSVEFVLVDKSKPIWSHSFKLGVAVLYHKFHNSDPISKNDLKELSLYLNQSLELLIQILENVQLGAVIGASGSFEVLEQLVNEERQNKNYSIIDTELFYPHYEEIINSSYQQRLEMSGIPDERAQLIVVAFELIHFVLKLTTPQNIIISDYAMKEGVLYEYLD